MSAQSGFLNCFLKFIQGDRGEKLPTMSRGRSPLSGARFAITMDERNAILAASSKRLKSEKEAEPKPEKQTRKRGRTRGQRTKGATRSTRSKGSVSEVDSESCGNEESEPCSKTEQRLCSNVDSNDGDESSSGDQNFKDVECGDKEAPSAEADGKSNDSVGENGNILRDSKGSKESSKKEGSPSENNSEAEPTTREKDVSATDEKAESADSERAVILNGEAEGSETKEPESADCAPTPDRKKRGRKRKNDVDKVSTPLRQLSSRKAKQKPLISYAESGDEEMPGLDDNSDSDDPVWVPEEKRGSSDEGSNFSWSKYDKLHLKTRKSGSHTPASQSRLRDRGDEKAVKLSLPENAMNSNPSVALKGAATRDKSEVSSEGTTPVKSTSSSNGVKTDPKNVIAATSNASVKIQPVVKADIINPLLIVMPFQSGTFIAQKTELEEKEEPPIWRVDGKSLLQKYEPFRAENGNTCYRNVSTYSGWGPKCHQQYQEIPVKFIKQNRVETIVEIIQAELPINEDKLCEKIMKEYEKHSYAYEVFVQTLVSQALDSNFLTEIIAEKDDYFLNCVEEIDKVCEGKKMRLTEACQWPKKLTESLATWPRLTMCQDESLLNNKCSVCYDHQNVTLMKMDGNPYKFSTLEYAAPSEESFKSKEFPVCSKCSEILILFHNIIHLKYHTYENGLKLVADKKALDPSKHNTDVLHDILADTERVKKEFQEISRMWAQAEIKSRRVKPVE